jgi:hypothetical protein
MRATRSLRLPDVKGWASPAFGAADAAALDIASPAADLLSGRQAGPADGSATEHDQRTMPAMTMRQAHAAITRSADTRVRRRVHPIRRVGAELTPQAIEQIARRVAQLLRSAPRENPPADDGSRPLVDAKELATLLGLTRDWVYEHAGELGAIPLGDGRRPRLRFDPVLAAERLKRQRRRPVDQPVEAVPAIEGPPRAQPRRRRNESNVPLLPVRTRTWRGVRGARGLHQAHT